MGPLLNVTPVVVGFDPGFASLGYAVVRLRERSEEVVDLGVIRTSKSDAKRRVLAADDNLRRARELAGAIGSLMLSGDLTKPKGRGVEALFDQRPTDVLSVRAVCAEAMSFPRNASTAAKMAMTWGALAAHIEHRSLPLLQASPQEVKVAVCGRKDASKEDVQAALLKRYGRSVKALLAKVPDGLHEHAFDALASVVACLQSDVLRMVRGLAA